MTTAPIPDDIMQVALRIANRKDVLSLPFETREALADDIARAIMAERSRHSQFMAHTEYREITPDDMTLAWGGLSVLVPKNEEK